MADEKQWIQRAKEGDTTAFEQLVTTYERKVFALALRSTGSEADAADLTQEVFLRAWRSLDRFRGDSSVSTWLYRITMNICIDFSRRKNLQLVPLSDEEGNELPIPDRRPAHSPETALDRRELPRELSAAIQQLSEAHREVLLLRDVSGLSYQEVGRMLSLEEGTVKSRLARARKSLRNILIKRGNILLPSSSKEQERGQENG